MIKHLIQITPSALEAAEGMFLCAGKVPKTVKMIDLTDDMEVEVIRDSASDPYAFINPGKKSAQVAGTYTVTLLTAGLSAFQGADSITAFLPVEYREDVNGVKKYRDMSGREIMGFAITDFATVDDDVVTFDLNGVTQTLTEGAGQDWLKGADAAAAATNLAAAITALSNVSAVADGINVYLIQEVGYPITTLTETGTGITVYNQPKVYDLKGNLMDADPKLKEQLPKGFKVDSSLITASQILEFAIEI